MEEALLFCRKCYAGQPIAHRAAPPLAEGSLTQNQGDFAVRAYRRFEELLSQPISDDDTGGLGSIEASLKSVQPVLQASR
jgi:hypothetical protein